MTRLLFKSPSLKLSASAVFRRLCLGVALFVIASATASANLPQEIRTTIQLANDFYSPSEKLLAKVSYTNTAEHEVRVLKWETVLNGRIDVDFLEIEHEGFALPYTGRLYKRPRPSAQDYVSFAPGETKSVDVDLESGYDVNYQGDYEVFMRGQYRAAKQESEGARFKLTKDRPITFKRTPIIRDCSANQDSEIDSALSAAESITARARNDLRNTPVSERANARRYQEWFGAYTESRWNRVQSNFDRIYSAVSGRTITFICDPTESAFAYVFTNRPYDIYLGSAFWSAPRTGTDSKAGTIVHELSHFNVVASTDDHVYGQSGARSLARSNPNLAVDNADSQEYFAENTPFLSMPAGSSSTPLVPSSLVLSSLASSETESTPSKQFNVSGLLTNSGTVPENTVTITVSMTTNSTLDGTQTTVGSFVIPSVESGASVNFDIPSIAPSEEGNYSIFVCAASSNSSGFAVTPACSSAIPFLVKKSSSISPILDLLLGEDSG